MSQTDHDRRSSTALGVLAILFWSSTVAISRSLAEEVGALTAAAVMLSLGGALGLVYVAAIQRRLRPMLRLPPAYLIGCGLMFVAYMACLYLAIGLASSRQQTLEVGLINYLWPGLTLAFAVPLLGTKVRAGFLPGVLLGLAGATIAPLRLGQYSFEALFENLGANPAPYALALVAAVLWALYSVLSRRWAGGTEGGAVPLFALAAGAVLAVMAHLAPEESRWTARSVAEVLFMAVFPILIAYAFWDRAMRRGNVTLVAALSYLTPLLSTVISGAYLGVAVGWNLWLACALIVAGAALCERSVVRT